MADISALSFDTGSLNLDPEADFIARVPAGISDRGALLEVLRSILRFPNYFGNNWDALADCLRDLSWIRQRRVVVLHDDIPPLHSSVVSTYLEVLADCVRDWKPGEGHELIVVFPPGARDAISRVASD
jgi:hypothetical protein